MKKLLTRTAPVFVLSAALVAGAAPASALPASLLGLTHRVKEGALNTVAPVLSDPDVTLNEPGYTYKILLGDGGQVTIPLTWHSAKNPAREYPYPVGAVTNVDFATVSDDGKYLTVKESPDLMAAFKAQGGPLNIRVSGINPQTYRPMSGTVSIAPRVLKLLPFPGIIIPDSASSLADTIYQINNAISS